LILLRDATRLGRSADAILRGARAGELVRIHPGAYVAADAWARLRPEARLRTRVHASHRMSRRDLVYSHESAAVVLGIPLLGALPDRPHVIDMSASARSTPAMRRTVRALDRSDIVTTDGIRTTGPLSTAIDIAATRS